MGRHLLILLLLILNCEVFAQSDSLRIKEIIVEGNKRTKEWIILRECGFEVGQHVAKADLNKVKQELFDNVTNQQLYASVSADPIVVSDTEVLLLIVVTERWYRFPVPIFELAEPNFNVWWRNLSESRTNYGLKLNDYNFRGRREYLSAAFKLGYTRQFSLTYESPYLFKDSKWGLYARGYYAENEEVNIGTVDNERVFYRGEDNDTRISKGLSLGTSYQQDIYRKHGIYLDYNDTRTADTIAALGSDYLLSGQSRMQHFDLVYTYTDSKVDRRGYPLEGRNIFVLLKKNGLGIMPGAPDIGIGYASYSQYIPLGKRWHTQHMIRAKGSLYKDEYPYHLQRGLGYENASVRSYEYYVMDGQHYGLLRNNLKFTLLPEKNLPAPAFANRMFGRLGLAIYLNLIGDLGYVSDELYNTANPLNNTWLYGTGLGLDFVSNYDITFRLEGTINHLGEPGIFIHYSRSI